MEASPALALSLATRTGATRGPYLRTPEGFLLAGQHALLEWLERAHPEVPTLPPAEMPVRRICARLLEDWIMLWLPAWPGRSWHAVERMGAHRSRTPFLLGDSPCRADYLFAAWLEGSVLIHENARGHALRVAPRLLSLGNDLLDRTRGSLGRGMRETATHDDVVPISLLGVLGALAGGYLRYLELNRKALEAGLSELRIDLGLGPQSWPARRVCEARRIAIAKELAALDPAARKRVRRVLEPVSAWNVFALPPAIAAVDPRDPRSL